MSILYRLARSQDERDCCRGLPHDATEIVCTVCHTHHELEHILASTIVPVALLLIIAVLITVTSCWCYLSKRRKREIAVITEKGELVVLKDDRKDAKKQGQLVVRISQLESRHSEHNSYSDSNHEKINVELGGDKIFREIQMQHSSSESNIIRGSIPLTEDGYAILEPESRMQLGYSNIEFTTIISPKESEDCRIEDSDCKQDEGQDCMINNISDHYEVSENFKKDHDYEELYWEPANREEELLDQLSKLGVPEIPAKSIELREQLGSGQFAIVQHGIWSRRVKSETDCKDIDVAVKIAENGSKLEERVKFLQEAVIMGQFKNPYILQIFGIINEDNLKIVTEIMLKGDLHGHLLSLRQEDGHQECKELGAILLSYTRQIALGMGYLSLKQFVHRDLAARNVLVSEKGICKIADFGLTRDLQHETYYMSHGGMIPVKWTAPEALHYRKYSTASDVWSYGCLLYEIWSLGYKPFHDITNAEAIQKICSGYRLPPPPGCPRSIYQLMITCWHPDPSSRHHACDITVALQQPDFQILSWTEETTNVNKRARCLANSLEDGHNLYKDLQNTYMHNNVTLN